MSNPFHKLRAQLTDLQIRLHQDGQDDLADAVFAAAGTLTECEVLVLQLTAKPTGLLEDATDAADKAMEQAEHWIQHHHPYQACLMIRAARHHIGRALAYDLTRKLNLDPADANATVRVHRAAREAVDTAAKAASNLMKLADEHSKRGTAEWLLTLATALAQLDNYLEEQPPRDSGPSNN